jgi:hypothetical protein
MNPKEAYNNYLNLVDPADPIVSNDIRRGARHVYGITDIHHHLPLLFKSAYGNVFEIGVRFGVSTSALLSGVEAHGGHLYSVDIDPKCQNLFNHPQWSFKGIDSKQVDEVKRWLPEKLDLLFIDGDHSYEGCFSDLMNYGPMSQSILLHDANLDENPSVSTAIHDYLSFTNTRHKLVKVYPESHGLAVLS